MFGQPVHPGREPALITAPGNAESEAEDLMNLQEQQRLASELANLLVLHEAAPLTHAETRAWLQELLAAGAGVGEV